MLGVRFSPEFRQSLTASSGRRQKRLRDFCVARWLTLNRFANHLFGLVMFLAQVLNAPALYRCETGLVRVRTNGDQIGIGYAQGRGCAGYPDVRD